MSAIRPPAKRSGRTGPGRKARRPGFTFRPKPTAPRPPLRCRRLASFTSASREGRRSFAPLTPSSTYSRVTVHPRASAYRRSSSSWFFSCGLASPNLLPPNREDALRTRFQSVFLGADGAFDTTDIPMGPTAPGMVGLGKVDGEAASPAPARLNVEIPRGYRGHQNRISLLDLYRPGQSPSTVNVGVS